MIYDTGPFPETLHSTFACFKKMNEMTEETMFSIASELIKPLPIIDDLGNWCHQRFVGDHTASLASI